MRSAVVQDVVEITRLLRLPIRDDRRSVNASNVGGLETVEQTDAGRAVDRSRSQRRRNAETTEQIDCGWTADRSRIQRRRRVQKSAMQTFEAATQKCCHADTHLHLCV